MPWKVSSAVEERLKFIARLIEGEAMAKGGGGIARQAPMSVLEVGRLTRSAFVGGAPGLQLAITANATKSWRLFYGLPGDKRRRALNLGRYPGVSLADARRRANEALATALAGDDPKTLRQARARQSTLFVDAALDRYLGHCASENDARTAGDKAGAFASHVRPTLGRMALPHVRRSDLMALLDGLVDRHGMRRNLYAYLHHFMAWAVERDLIEANPLAGVRAPKPVAARDRVLSDDEIRALWLAEGETAALARVRTGNRAPLSLNAH
jgi:hypothetical protein